MKKTNLQAVKQNNRALILSCLKKGAASRADIVRKTGLSKGTVTLLINEFIESGEITEKGINSSGAVGRPQVTLEISAKSKYAVGFALHRKTLGIVIVDLNFSPVFTFTVPTAHFKTPESAMDFLYSAMEDGLKKHSVPKEKLLGIGVSCPGPLDYRSGIIISPPNLTLFHNFSVKEYLKTKTDLPIFLDNNSVLLALRESSICDGGFKNSMFVVASDGIGSAILKDGEVFRGSSGYSGEIGHISVVPDGIPCPCGNKGCLERYVSLPALKESFGFKNYSDAVKGNNQNELIDYVAKNLSAVLISSVNLLDLDCIILFGELNDSENRLINRLENEINSRSIIRGAHKIEVLASKQNRDGNLLCSASAILKAYFEQRL